MVSFALAAALALAPLEHVAYLKGGRLVVLDLATRTERIVMTQAPAGPVRWSGDGKLVSDGGRIAGGPSLPTQQIVWAPTGETGAYVTKAGGVGIWTPRGRRRVAADGWGATALAWSGDGRLAIGRAAYARKPNVRELWTWTGHRLRRALALGSTLGQPLPVVWHAGRIVWWAYPDSASIAADGVALYSNRTRIGSTLMYTDYVVRCGAHLAFAAGGDRYATHGKRIVFDGRDVSHDPSRSWVSPSCGHSLLVAAAGRNWEEDRFGHEHRAIWQLLPIRKQLTHPPKRWTDENPRVLGDGSIVFVRSRLTARKVKGVWYATNHGELERLFAGTVTPIADLTFTANETSALGTVNYYGHYGWPWLLAVAR